MTGNTSCTDDVDSLHVLPLSIIPLRTASLRHARLVKNARMEGMIEMFAGDSTGIGTIAPSELEILFEFSGDNIQDLSIIGKLADLPSYDVFSLRATLRQLGIAVDEHASLRLSERRSQDLATYMTAYTRPLILAIYGDEEIAGGGFADLLSLLANPKMGQARQNLADLARRLDIDVSSIPAFIANYGDAYLSLAYFQYCLDGVQPALASFYRAVADLRRDTLAKHDPRLMSTCHQVEAKLQCATTQVAGLLDTFRARTVSLWEDITDARLRALNLLVDEYQATIGSDLCVVTVKMNAWQQEFPTAGRIAPAKLARFLTTDMSQGLERIKAIDYQALQNASATTPSALARPLHVPAAAAVERLETVYDDRGESAPPPTSPPASSH